MKRYGADDYDDTVATQHQQQGGEEASLLRNPRAGSVSAYELKETGNKYNSFAAFLIFFFPACGGLLFGYDIGATSAVVSQLQSPTDSGVEWYGMVASSSFLVGCITSVGMLGALMGSLTCFRIADEIGRRKSLLIAAVLFGLGSFMEFVSGEPTWSGTFALIVLMLGRCTYGLGCGFAMHGAPAYIGEMAPSSIRGLLVSMKEAFIVLGMVLGYAIGYAYSSTPGGWRYTYGCSSIVAIIMFCGISYLPPSSRWLALRGRINESKRALQFVSPELGERDIDALRELALKASRFSSDEEQSLSDDWVKLSSDSILPALVAGVGLVVLQQITGQPSVLYYAVSLFDDVGLSKMSSIAISLFKLVATLIATFTVDQYGRKLLLYIGCSLMTFALLVLTGAFMFPYAGSAECAEYSTSSGCNEFCEWNVNACVEETCIDSGFMDSECSCCNTTGINTQKSVILIALFVYIGGYQVGFGPISWLIISEIFPLEVRGKAVSIAVVCNFFFNFVMTLIFPEELDLLGASATFLIYAVILVAGIYFIFRYVPETKGLTLEEIEDFFIRSSKSFGGVDGVMGESTSVVGASSYQQSSLAKEGETNTSGASVTSARALQPVL